MRSTTNRRFKKQFRSLPTEIQRQARETYAIWKSDPFRTGLKFRRVHPAYPVYSVRIGEHWRAVAFIKDGEATWVWIGSHSDYDKYLDSL